MRLDANVGAVTGHCPIGIHAVMLKILSKLFRRRRDGKIQALSDIIYVIRRAHFHSYMTSRGVYNKFYSRVFFSAQDTASNSKNVDGTQNDIT